jgi:hypothetical protein
VVEGRFGRHCFLSLVFSLEETGVSLERSCNCIQDAKVADGAVMQL